MRFTIFFLLICLHMPVFARDNGAVTIEVGGKSLITYQAAPLENPKGNDKNPAEQFKGSNFIHPLKTPSGFSVTSIQPADHLHHFGLWWPWKHIQIGERIINCWEMQAGEGIVQAKSFKPIKNGLMVMQNLIISGMTIYP